MCPHRPCVHCAAARIARLAFIRLTFVPRRSAEWLARVDRVRSTLANGDWRFCPSKFRWSTHKLFCPDNRPAVPGSTRHLAEQEVYVDVPSSIPNPNHSHHHNHNHVLWCKQCTSNQVSMNGDTFSIKMPKECSKKFAATFKRHSWPEEMILEHSFCS